MSPGRLSILAGQGELPLIVKHAAAAGGWQVQYLSFLGREEEEVADARQIDLRKPLDIVLAIRGFRSTHVCLAGAVHVSDKKREGLFKFLGSKKGGGKPKTGGDTGLSRLGRALEIATGTKLVGAHEIAPELLVREGLVAGPKPDNNCLASGTYALHTAIAAGKLDLGQAAVCSGLRVVAVEDIAGTDSLLKRVGQFRKEGLVGDAGYALTLAKARKPDQPMFVDLPAIGPDTIVAASDAGITGVFLDADHSIIIGRDRLTELAEEKAISVYGLRADHV
jgi:DUF1009 family protein